MSTPIYDQLMMIQSPPFHPLEEERPTDQTKEDKNPVGLFFGAPSVQYSDQASISGISSTSTTYSMNPTQAHDHPGGSSTATELQLIKDYDQQLIHEHHQAANGKYSPCSTDESSDHQQFLPASCSSSDSALLLNDNNYGLIMKSADQDIEQEWRMPLKIRFMRKYSYDQMAAGTHDQESVLLRSDPNRNQEFHQPAAAAPAAFNAENSTSTITMNNNIRICSDCSTTKTPLWRGGPRGPKSLCNACGIRQRKARRAMAAAAAAAAATGTNNIVPENTSPVPPRKVQHIKEKKTNKGSFHDQTPAAAVAATGTNNIVPENGSPVPPRKVQHIKEKKTNKGSFHDQTTSVANKQEKKQSNKLMNSCSSGSSTASCSSSRKKKQKQQAKKLCFEDWVVSLSENHSDFHSAVFPQDEKEAAILLMALSCGLVYG